MSGQHLSPSERDIYRIVQTIRQMMQGRDDASGIINLTVSTTSTVVAAPSVSPTSNILLSPATANAAAEWQNGTIYVLRTDVSQGQFRITHANNNQADRAIFWAARG